MRRLHRAAVVLAAMGAGCIDYFVDPPDLGRISDQAFDGPMGDAYLDQTVSDSAREVEGDIASPPTADVCTPSSEICDGSDNDCDGNVDERLSERSDGQCDGVDNDCDGRIDEDVSCITCGAATVQPPCNGCPQGTMIPDGWVCIPSGSFFMGSPMDEMGSEENERPQHEVLITHPFLMSETELTRVAWFERFCTCPATAPPAVPSPADDLRCHGGVDCPVGPLCPNCPIETVNWYEAAAYANSISREHGFPECYSLIDCEDDVPIGHDRHCQGVEQQEYECGGYRLPTEAEWEYAARARSDGSIWIPSEEDDCVVEDGPPMERVAWYGGNAGGLMHPVGTRCPNEWGLYDMIGSVWEMTSTLYAAYPDVVPGQPLTDPISPDVGDGPVHRGGSFRSNDAEARSARRDWADPRSATTGLGFRLVRAIHPSYPAKGKEAK